MPRATMAFTDRGIQALRPGAVRYEVMEENGHGLGLRVTPSGQKTWFYLYRLRGRLRRMTLGPYPRVTLADAHTAHRLARDAVKAGEDPAEQKLAAQTGEGELITVAGLVREYMEKWAKPRKKSWPEDQRVLDREVVPHWGDRPVDSIKRREVVQLLQGIVDRGAEIQANRTLAVVRKMFNFGLSRSLLESSPCLGVSAPGKEHRRDRVLSENEIRVVWSKLDGLKMSVATRLALRLMLVTAQRKGEIVHAEWKEVDLVNGWWTIPAEKTKNGLAHRVPLSPLALQLLGNLKVVTGHTRWLLPSPRADQPFNETALNRALLRQLAQLGVEPFTPHDLRRTAASLMSSLGVPRLVIGKILNHAEPGVTAVYDRHSYDQEKRAALDRWAQRLMEITTLSAP